MQQNNVRNNGQFARAVLTNFHILACQAAVAIRLARLQFVGKLTNEKHASLLKNFHFHYSQDTKSLASWDNKVKLNLKFIIII